MDWFKINDEGEIEFVNEEVKLVPEVQAMLRANYNKGPGDHDGRKKLKAKKEIKYLVLGYSRKSPYADYNEKERLKQAFIDAKLEEPWNPSVELEALIPKFKEGNKNRVTRMIYAAMRFLDKLETQIDSIDLNERNMTSGALIHNPKQVMDTLRGLPAMAETLTELERQARTDIVKKTSSKGDHELGWMSGGEKITKRAEEDDTDISTQDGEGN